MYRCGALLSLCGPTQVSPDIRITSLQAPGGVVNSIGFKVSRVHELSFGSIHISLSSILIAESSPSYSVSLSYTTTIPLPYYSSSIQPVRSSTDASIQSTVVNLCARPNDSIVISYCVSFNKSWIPAWPRHWHSTRHGETDYGTHVHIITNCDYCREDS